MKKQALLKAQEELKLLKMLNEQAEQEQRIQKQIMSAKQQRERADAQEQQIEAEFIGKEFPNYDSP